MRAYLDASIAQDAVFALSSGFMTYSSDVHPAYHELRARLESRVTTSVLLPSLDVEVCVRETVRRQLTRPFSRSAEREEAVIRQRFEVYSRLPARKVETLGTIDAAVDRLLVLLKHDASNSSV